MLFPLSLSQKFGIIFSTLKNTTTITIITTTTTIIILIIYNSIHIHARLKCFIFEFWNIFFWTIYFRYELPFNFPLFLICVWVYVCMYACMNNGDPFFALLVFGPCFTAYTDKSVTYFLFLHHFSRPLCMVMHICKDKCLCASVVLWCNVCMISVR